MTVFTYLFFCGFIGLKLINWKIAPEWNVLYFQVYKFNYLWQVLHAQKGSVTDCITISFCLDLCLCNVPMLKKGKKIFTVIWYWWMNVIRQSDLGRNFKGSLKQICLLNGLYFLVICIAAFFKKKIVTLNKLNSEPSIPWQKATIVNTEHLNCLLISIWFPLFLYCLRAWFYEHACTLSASTSCSQRLCMMT